ncbi:aryl-alcohol dehydrogenase-like predicted oxidoreductase [Hydrogenivirga caldilitoris]|uniref:Aryl-alcohol dehydrogenase-like predicted oxidoreductase n=1 Tax=Hydrogenivirga caldilitoris TaxID=246264 RepID=A0A497XND6_9AQUI|nr:aldo/keto reductase [Hydrogenivirga caldilitoris]RLJ70476.1 aryl-alcohol dehydrogenase-like predicted oxidoreductase [Hydrogenivirga caldilitoris]
MIYKDFQGEKLSELGIGTYLGELDEATDKGYEETIKLGVEKGINVVDTAINYRYMKSERAIGRVINEVGRERLFLSTKGGYVPFDADAKEDPKVFFEETFLRGGLIDLNEMTPQGHYLGKEFINWCFEKSLENMNTSYVDVYFIHNPEEHLLFTEKERFYEKLKECFYLLENKVKEGKLKFYGLATWQGFRIPKGARQHLELAEILELAEEAGGKEHHFKFIQLPYNLGMHEAYSLKNQTLDGVEVSVLEACHRLGIYVYTSASLYQGNVIGRVPEKLKERFGVEKDVHVALQFVRSTPGVGTALVGMSKPEHLIENLDIETKPPLSEEEFSSLFK